MCSSQLWAVYMSQPLPWGCVPGVSECVRVHLYNSLIRNGTALVLTDFKFTGIYLFYWHSVYTDTHPHTHTMLQFLLKGKKRAGGCCKALRTLSFSLMLYSHCKCACVLNYIIIIITVIISHYRYITAKNLMYFDALYLLCHCVARVRGVNYVRRAHVCVFDAR